jgi:hypothetical protein
VCLGKIPAGVRRLVVTLRVEFFEGKTERRRSLKQKGDS